MKFTSPRDSADRHGNAASRMPVQKVDDTQLIQEAQLNGFAGEQMDTIEHVHPYGFTNVVQPSTGSGDQAKSAEGMTSFLGSNRSHGVTMVSADRRYRLYKLANGEVALHDDQGQQVHFKRDGIWGSVPNSKKIVMQIMDDDTIPRDSGATEGQIKQAGRPAAVNLTFTKTAFTLNHPNGDVTINAKTFTVNASSDIKLISATNALLKGASAILYATSNAFMKAISTVNIKSPINRADPPFTTGAADPPISG